MAPLWVKPWSLNSFDLVGVGIIVHPLTFCFLSACSLCVLILREAALPFNRIGVPETSPTGHHHVELRAYGWKTAALCGRNHIEFSCYILEIKYVTFLSQWNIWPICQYLFLPLISSVTCNHPTIPGRRCGDAVAHWDPRTPGPLDPRWSSQVDLVGFVI